MARKENRLRKVLSKKLYNKLWIVITLAVVFGLTSIYEVLIGALGILFAGGSFLLGLLVGSLPVAGTS